MNRLYSILKGLKRHAIVREHVRRYRLRSGRPHWPFEVGREWQRDEAHNHDPPQVLIATGGGGYLAALHLEAILSVALSLRGARCHVLLCDGVLPGCLQCTLDWEPTEERFARAGTSRGHCSACYGGARATYEKLGITVHRISDFVTEQELREADETSRTTPFDQIANLERDGVRVGEHAYAGALRFYARARLQDPHAEAVLRRYLRAALIATAAARRVIRSYAISHGIVHHGIYVPQGVVAEVMRQETVAVTTWHVAYRTKSFIFSHGDTYHRSLMSEPVSSWENIAWTAELQEQTLRYLYSRWHGSEDWIKFHSDPVFNVEGLEQEIGLDFSRPCIGLLTNVMWDAQLHYPANAFPSMLDWLLHTVQYFAARPALQLVIRVHPAEISGTVPSRQRVVEELADAFPTLPPNVFIVPPESRISTYALMSKCNAAIIYGTKTGVELTSMGIPVIVAGEAWIRNKGIAFDASSVEEYERMLNALPLPSRLPDETVERARKYAFHFFFRRMIPFEFLTAVSGQPPFRAESDVLEHLAPGRSKGLDVVCDGILRGSEFIYPAEELLSATPDVPLALRQEDAGTAGVAK